MTIQEKTMIKKVKEVLTPDLIPDYYRDGKVDNPMYGHCHHASLALYDLLGGKDEGYKLRKGIDGDGITHYWLENPKGEILDPTVEQYTETNRKPPYDNQIKRGVSYRRTKASKEVLKRVNEKK